MQIVIDIPEEEYMLIKQKMELNVGGVTSEAEQAIVNGTPLPKGHGRLIDADAFEIRCMFDSNIEDMQDVIYALRDYKPIIEADKTKSEDKHTSGKDQE